MAQGPNELMELKDFDQGQGWARDPFHVLKNSAMKVDMLITSHEVPSDPLVKRKVEKLWQGDEGQENKKLAEHRLNDAHVPNTLVSKHFRSLFLNPKGLSGVDSILFVACVMKVFLFLFWLFFFFFWLLIHLN